MKALFIVIAGFYQILSFRRTFIASLKTTDPFAVPFDTVAIPATDIQYDIRYGPLDETADVMSPLRSRAERCLIITDESVGRLYAERLVASLDRARWTVKVIQVPAGEASKSLSILETIFDEALNWGIDRRVPVIALGGGVVGDLAGLAAATLLRGLPLIQIPTTLIAQVDSSIGGKTGINHSVGKNLIGSFHQPFAVITDPSVLRTLPDREWDSGMAEVVKHALIADADFARWLIDKWESVSSRDERIVQKMVRRAAQIKVEIVQEDVFESGGRALLNFGHTFGHAIERVAGFGVFTHGEAVAVGMKAALYVSAMRYPAGDFTMAEQLVDAIPVQGDRSMLSVSQLNDSMRFDKKVEAGRLRLIGLKEIGKAEVFEEVEQSVLDAAWRHAKSV